VKLFFDAPNVCSQNGLYDIKFTTLLELLNFIYSSNNSI